MKCLITPRVVVAYPQCKLKAYLLLKGRKGTKCEFIDSLEEKVRKNKENFISMIKINKEVCSYSPSGFKRGAPIMFKATLTIDDLKAYPDVLVRIKKTSSKRKHNYSPTLVVGTNKVSKAQKLQLAFIGHVLSKLQMYKPESGTIVASGNKSRKIKLVPLYKEVELILIKLRVWTHDSRSEAPPVILNKNCPYCKFQKECEAEAIEKDHLSLLRRMSPKEIEQQNKKGIFTVNQFAYTYRPQKKNKRQGKRAPKNYHSLKALAIRDNKIYVVEKPKVPSTATQLYLDVEGEPDQNSYYLIGLVVVEESSEKTFSFWADKQEDEKIIYNEFLTLARKYSEFTLFHYGSYETLYGLLLTSLPRLMPHSIDLKK